MSNPPKKIWTPSRTSGGVLNRAKELRKEMTPAEKVLWKLLRGRHFDGIKFRRQHPVGSYILDFFCYEHRLAIELDGEIHLQQEEQDKLRDATLLTSFNIRVIRFKNDEVISDIGSVLERIKQ